MIFDAELSAYKFGNAGGRPEIGPVALRHRPIHQQTYQTPTLPGVQFPRASGRLAYASGVGWGSWAGHAALKSERVTADR